MTFKFPGEVFLRLKPQSPVLNAALQRRHWPRWLRSAGPAHTAPPAVPFAIARAALPCRARSPERPRRSAGRLRSAARPSALPCSPRSPLLHKCRLQQPLVYSAPAAAAPALPGSSVLTPGSRWIPAGAAAPRVPPAAPQPLTFNSRVPLPPAALPRHRAGRQAPAWLSRGSWCWPGTALGAAACAALVLPLWVTHKFLLGLAGAWPLPSPVYSQFQEVRGCARSCWIQLAL